MFTVGQEVVRRNGEQQGRKAKIWGAGYTDSGNGWINIVYLDDKSERVHECVPENFVLADQWQEKSPYKPKPATIKEIKLFAFERIFTTEGEDEKYVLIFYGRIDARILRRLVADGFLKKVGRLGALLKSKGLSWNEWWKEEWKKGNHRPLHHNDTIYQVIKDVNDFLW